MPKNTSLRLKALRTIRRALIGLIAVWIVWGSALASAQDTEAARDREAIDHAKGLSRAFRAVSKKELPAVVKVKTSTKARAAKPGAREPRENPFQGTPFEDFFNKSHPGLEGDDGSPAREGLGSGVIINAQGIILTNNHVVEGADDVIVELSNGRQYHSVDVRTDAQSDLAIVRIKADAPLTTAPLGDSDNMEIGDWVLAIGNPFDLDLTVSAGIISGKSRVLPSGRRAEFLQTDAAINPGNSGGPLINLDGEVIGINTAIASSSGGYQGIGFAIPSKLAKWVSRQLISKGVVERAYLGVRIEEINADLAQRLRVLPGQGVLVNEILPGSPAAKAGLQAGDIVVAFGGAPVHNPRQLQEVVEQSPLGSSHPMDILREGKPQQLNMVATALPKELIGPVRRKMIAPEDVAPER
jgi:serine protease Do